MAIDCFNPLRVAETATQLEDQSYYRSRIAQPTAT